MKIRTAYLATLFSCACTLSSGAATASADENHSIQDEIYRASVEQGDTSSSTVPAFTEDRAPSVRSAGGLTAAPGGNGAYVGLNVRGSGLHVRTAYVNYFPGTKIAGSNASAQEFELTWHEHGRRQAQTKGGDSGFVRATRKWDFNRNIDAGPMCGRVRVGDEWSNYSCVNIKP